MKTTNGLAIASLVLGLVSWVAAPCLASFAAVVCGHMARTQIRASNGTQEGDGLALAGLILGYLNIVVALGAIFVIFVVFGVAGFSSVTR